MDQRESSAFGLLHPGAMGVTVAATLRASEQEVVWVSAGRSSETCARARRAGLRELAALDELLSASHTVISVCPPHAAEGLLDEVISLGYTGRYLDANAISPERARAMGKRFEASGGSFVDGGIVGPPALRPGTTWLHLSGCEAAELSGAFAAGPLATSVVSDRVGDASALKMCYAAFTKGSTALLAAQLASAHALGVRSALEDQWEREDAGSAQRAHERLRRVTAKAWRFEAEMREISATFAAAGMPAGFHDAAAQVYARLAGFRSRSEHPGLVEVLEALTPEP